jgi:hypothetical protein
MSENILRLLKAGDHHSLLQNVCAITKAANISTKLLYNYGAYSRWVWGSYTKIFAKATIDFTWLRSPLTILLNKSTTYYGRQRFKEIRGGLLPAIPLIVFIIMPFGELCIPPYIHLFPNTIYYHFLPEYFGAKLMAKAIQSMVINQVSSYLKIKSGSILSPTLVENNVSKLSTSDLVAFARVFKKNVISGYETVYKILSLDFERPFSKSLILLQISFMLNELMLEDLLITRESYKEYPLWKLENVVSERGMVTYGMGRAEMEEYLGKWMTLSELARKKLINKQLLLFAPFYDANQCAKEGLK